MKLSVSKNKVAQPRAAAGTHSEKTGSAPFSDNRAETTQLKGLQAMADSHAASVQATPEKENRTGLPDNLKTGIESLSGHSMNDVKVHYNSEKPAQLQAHAYAQGSDIHLAPGQEKHLPHEAWHVVQQKQGRVKPTLQMKDKTAINDNLMLEKEADSMGAKAKAAGKGGAKETFSAQLQKAAGPATPVVQRVQSTLVGEHHRRPKIQVNRKTTLLTNAGVGWTKQAQPSKLAAALIQHNAFAPPTNYKAELQRHMNINGSLKAVMETAEKISNGTEPLWGAENNLIGLRTSAQVAGPASPPNARTHIENATVRANAGFIKTLSLIGGHSLPEDRVAAGYPDKSAYQTLRIIGGNAVEEAFGDLNRGSAPLKAKWDELKAANGYLGRTAHVASAPAAEGTAPDAQPENATRQWVAETITNIERAFQELLEVAINETNRVLGDQFNHPLRSQEQQLIKTMANKKYGSEANVMSRMHAFASIARTLTQMSGIDQNNQTHQPAADGTVPKTGYILGDSHLDDLDEMKNTHAQNDRLKSVLDHATLVRIGDYGDLKQSAKDAVVATNRGDTLEIT